MGVDFDVTVYVDGDGDVNLAVTGRRCRRIPRTSHHPPPSTCHVAVAVKVHDHVNVNAARVGSVGGLRLRSDGEKLGDLRLAVLGRARLDGQVGQDLLWRRVWTDPFGAPTWIHLRGGAAGS